MQEGPIRKKIQEIVEEAISTDRDHISLEEERKIKDTLRRYLGQDCVQLLQKLRSDCNGLKWGKPQQGCPSQRLISLGLARYDNGGGESLLKATRLAFQEEVLFLIGITRTY